MYIQQWQDLVGPLQHHRGFQQNILSQTEKLYHRRGLVQPIPSAYLKSDFKQILYIHKQQKKQMHT